MADNLLGVVLYGVAGGVIAWLAGLILKKMGYDALAPSEGEKKKKGLIIVAIIIILLAVIPIWHKYGCDVACKNAISNWLRD